jgi:hypothetical protein
MGRLAIFVALSLLAGTVVAEFPATCKTAVKNVADYSKGYLCPEVNNGCHQTATRLAPMFVAPDAVKVDHASFDTLYASICGATKCIPQKDAIYQISIMNAKCPHSLLLACRKPFKPQQGSMDPEDPRGCTVLQSWAGQYALHEWIHEGDVVRNRLERDDADKVTGNRISLSHENYGRFQEMSGEKLDTFLTLLNGLVTVDGDKKATGTFLSLTTVWLCTTVTCKNLLAAGAGHAVLPVDKDPWKTKLPDPTVGASIAANEYPWDGTCKAFDAAREHGAAFPSPWCLQVGKRGTCTYGLSMYPSAYDAADDQTKLAQTPAKGHLPPDFEEAFECLPRAPA